MLCALLSISGFVLRGIWMWRGSPALKHPIVKRLPHINDTLLLLAALYLAYSSQQYPFQVDWLTAKLIALFVYIGLGFITLRFGRTLAQKRGAFLLAVVVFAYIYFVARTRSPLPYLM